MKVLHTADLHLGRFLDNCSRAEEQRAVAEEIIAIAQQEAADICLLAGDIFDAFIPPAWAEALFYDLTLRLSDHGQRPVLVIAGNHDQPERLSAAAPLAAAQQIYIIDRPQLVELNLSCGEKVQVAALPYLSEARLGEVFTADIDDEQGAARDYHSRLKSCLAGLAAGFDPQAWQLVLAHLFVAGGSGSESERPLAATVQVGGSFGVAADIFPAADYVALGHLHRPQQIKLAQPCYYAGSPLAYSFSEADQQKRVLIGEFTRQSGEKCCHIRSILLQAGWPLTVYSALSYSEALAWCEDERHHNCWVSLNIRLEQPLTAAEIDALRQAHPRLSAINPVYPQLMAEQEQAQQQRQLDIAASFRRFAELNEGVSCDEALLKAFLELLEQPEEEEV